MSSRYTCKLGFLSLCLVLGVGRAASAQTPETPSVATPAAPAAAAPEAATTTTPPAEPAAVSGAVETPAALLPQAPAPAAAPVAPAHPKWTSSDVARVRAMLRAANQPGPVARATYVPPEPVKHGDAGAAFAVGVSIDAVFHADAGYDLFADDDVSARFGAFAAYDVIALADDLFVAVEAGFGYEGEQQTDLLASTLETELSTTTLHGALAARYVLFPWLQPQARLAAGASLLEMEVTSIDEPTDEDDAVSPFVSLGAGFLLRSPTRSFENRTGGFASLSFGVAFEAGYALRGPVDLKLGKNASAPAIALSQATLGELSMSGPYIRTSLVARF